MLNQRLLLWSFAGGAFIVTLGLSAWQNGLWITPEMPTVKLKSPAVPAQLTPRSTAIPRRPFAPAFPTFATQPQTQVAQTSPPPSRSDPLSEQTSPTGAPPPDGEGPALFDSGESEFRAHADRAAAHGTRSR